MLFPYLNAAPGTDGGDAEGHSGYKHDNGGPNQHPLGPSADNEMAD